MDWLTLTARVARSPREAPRDGEAVQSVGEAWWEKGVLSRASARGCGTAGRVKREAPGAAGRRGRTGKRQLRQVRFRGREPRGLDPKRTLMFRHL